MGCLYRCDGSILYENSSLKSTRSLLKMAIKEGIDLSEIDLSEVKLIGLNFSGANLLRASFRDANVSKATFDGADLSGASFGGAIATHATFDYAKLKHARFIYTDLRSASFKNADLTNVCFESATIDGVDFSASNGLLSAKEWLDANCEKDRLGYIVYKRIGETEFPKRPEWVIERGSFITETCSPSRTISCGCGVNCGTLEWCTNNYKDANLWKCRIRVLNNDGSFCADLADVVVPFNTDGKIRCGRLELLEIIHGENDES